MNSTINAAKKTATNVSSKVSNAVKKVASNVSNAACVPFAGVAATGTKFASKGAKAAKAANKLENAAGVAKKTISSLKKGAGELPQMWQAQYILR